MLTCLRIRDLAIIDSLDVELGPGLNVLTGESVEVEERNGAPPLDVGRLLRNFPVALLATRA